MASPPADIRPGIELVLARHDGDDDGGDVQHHDGSAPMKTPGKSDFFEEQFEGRREEEEVTAVGIPPPPFKKAVGISPPPTFMKPSNTNVDSYDDGYDSDGEIGPHFDAVEDEVGEEEMMEREDASLPFGMGGEVMPEPVLEDYVPAHIPIDDNLLNKMAVAQLKEELVMRGVKPKGRKNELKSALKKALDEKNPCNTPMGKGGASMTARDKALSGFPDSTSKFLHKRTRTSTQLESKRSEREKKRRTEKVGVATRAKVAAKVAADAKPPRAPIVSDSTLDPVNGALKIRLDTSAVHMFDAVAREEAGGKSCQLCRWATGIKTMSHMVKCDDCKVVLCTSCWRSFHTVEDLVSIKEEIGAKSLAKKPNHDNEGKHGSNSGRKSGKKEVH